MAVNERAFGIVSLSGWVFLSSGTYCKIYKTEERQILTLASKNG